MGRDRVIYRADNGVGSVKSQVIGVYNPGTPESALIDMRLLSECSELVVTVGSSYGSVAAAWGGVVPVQMLHGLHKNVQVCVRPHFPTEEILTMTMFCGDSAIDVGRDVMTSLTHVITFMPFDFGRSVQGLLTESE